MILFLLVVADYPKSLAPVYIQKNSTPGKLSWWFFIIWAVSKCRWHFFAELPRWLLIKYWSVLYSCLNKCALRKLQWSCLFLAVKKSDVLCSSLAHDETDKGLFLYQRDFKPFVCFSWRKAVAWHFRIPPGGYHFKNLNTSLIQ